MHDCFHKTDGEVKDPLYENCVVLHRMVVGKKIQSSVRRSLVSSVFPLGFDCWFLVVVVLLYVYM